MVTHSVTLFFQNYLVNLARIWALSSCLPPRGIAESCSGPRSAGGLRKFALLGDSNGSDNIIIQYVVLSSSIDADLTQQHPCHDELGTNLREYARTGRMSRAVSS